MTLPPRLRLRSALLLPLLCGACAATSCALEAQKTRPAPAPQTAAAAENVPLDAPPPPSPVMQNALVRYQLALDQLASGHAVEARVILEDLVRRSGDRPEWNVLLASLLEREGKASQARRVLAKVQASPLALAYLSKLQDVPDNDATQDRPGRSAARIVGPTREDIATPEERAANNPARSPSADARLSRLEKLMLEMVNREREGRGLRELQWSDDLADVARAHSVEMRQKKYFAHESPTDSLRQPMNRYVAGIGATPRLVAENIYRAWGTQHQLSRADIDAGHTSLMNSPGHRTNILLAQAERCGIGISVNENGDIWVTQMFDRP